jgi:hypothetical protein
MQRKKVILSPLCVIELDIYVHITVLGRIAPGKRAKNPNAARPETVNLFQVLLHDRQRIYHTDSISPPGQKDNLAKKSP